MEDIARLLSYCGIPVYCYTARYDLDYSKCENLTINGSGFMPDAPHGNNFYVKVDGYDLSGVPEDKQKMCDRANIKNCGECGLCVIGNNYYIGVKLH